MQPIEMLAGNFNSAYYACFDSNTGYKVVSVGYHGVSKVPTYQPVYSQKAALLQMKMQNEVTVSKTKSGGIYIIDENYKYTLLSDEKSRMSMRHSTQDTAQQSYMTVAK